MASARLEQRVAALEAAVAKLQRKIEEREPRTLINCLGRGSTRVDKMGLFRL